MSNFFEFLLGLQPAQWVGGRFSFGTPIHVAVMIGGLAAIIGIVWVLYRKTTIAVDGRLKVFLITLRTSVLAALVLCLLQPMLITSRPIPRQNDVAVIVDNSRSMTIRDMGDGRSRGDVAVDLSSGRCFPAAYFWHRGRQSSHFRSGRSDLRERTHIDSGKSESGHSGAERIAAFRFDPD